MTEKSVIGTLMLDGEPLILKRLSHMLSCGEDGRVLQDVTYCQPILLPGCCLSQGAQ